MAITYHQLGITAQDRGRLDEAEDWYRKSLAISEELGNRPRMARIYHQLGLTARDRGRLDEADDWYRKSLAIKEELGNLPGMALTYGQLGLLAEDRQQPRQALEWMVRCVTLFDQFPHPVTGPGPSASGPAHPPARHVGPGGNLAAGHRPVPTAGRSATTSPASPTNSPQESHDRPRRGRGPFRSRHPRP